MSYNLPFDLYNGPMKAVVETVENGVTAKISQQMEIKVDKQELMKALNYDRGQYEQGYRDGLHDAVKHAHWGTVFETFRVDTMEKMSEEKSICSLCGKTNKNYRPPYCPHCGAKMDEEVKQ